MTQTEAFTRKAIGPQEVGGTYRCAYWGADYEVLHIGIGADSRLPWSAWSVTVRWSDGRTTTHCTAWDARDEVVR